MSRKVSIQVWLHAHRTLIWMVIGALLIYAVGIWWGLPEATAPDRIHPWGSDEIAPMGFGELYFTLLADHPRYDPRYPLFFFGVEAVFAAPYLAWLYVSGQLSTFSTSFPYGLANPVQAIQILTLLGRLPSLLAAAGIMAVAYQTGRALWDQRGALLSGLMVFLLYPMFYYSRTSNVDMTMLFFLALAVLRLVVILRDGFTPRQAIWLGIFSALALATKDAIFPVFAGMAFWLLLDQIQRARSRTASWGLFWKSSLVGLLAAGMVYALASGLVFNLERYITHINFIRTGSPEAQQAGFYFSRPPTLQSYTQVSVKYLRLVGQSLGLPFSLLALAGIGLSWRGDRRVIGLTLLGLTILFGAVLPVLFVFMRFALVNSYLTAFAGAYAARWGLRSSKRWLKISTNVLLGAGILWSALTAADLTQQMLNDSRYPVARQLQALLHPGDRVATPDLDGGWKLPHLGSQVQYTTLPRQDFKVSALPVNPPEFIIVIPGQEDVVIGEEFLDPALYQRLEDGSAGYTKVMTYRTPAWVQLSLLPWANPPVTVFIRSDLTDRLD